MSGGWIAFLILLAYIAGIATALVYGQWVISNRKNKEKVS